MCTQQPAPDAAEGTPQRLSDRLLLCRRGADAAAPGGAQLQRRGRAAAEAGAAALPRRRLRLCGRRRYALQCILSSEFSPIQQSQFAATRLTEPHDSRRCCAELCQLGVHAALRRQHLGFDRCVWDAAQVGWQPGARRCCASAAAWTPPSRRWTWRTQRWWDASPVYGTLASTRAAPICTADETSSAAAQLRSSSGARRPATYQTKGRLSLLQVKQLFALFLGSGSPGAALTDATVAAAAPAVQVKLMGLFCRSLAAANAFPHTLQVR